MEPEGAPIVSDRVAVDTAGGEVGFASPVRGRPLFTTAGGEKPADGAECAEEFGKDDDDVVGTGATERTHEEDEDDEDKEGSDVDERVSEAVQKLEHVPADEEHVAASGDKKLRHAQ